MALQDTAKTPPSGLFTHVIPVLQEELLDCAPVVCDVGLAIQLGVCEFAREIFAFPGTDLRQTVEPIW